MGWRAGGAAALAGTAGKEQGRFAMERPKPWFVILRQNGVKNKSTVVDCVPHRLQEVAIAGTMDRPHPVVRE